VKYFANQVVCLYAGKNDNDANMVWVGIGSKLAGKREKACVRVTSVGREKTSKKDLLSWQRLQHLKSCFL